MKKQIALFKNVKYGFDAIKVVEDNFDIDYWSDHDEYVLLSEIITVDFPEMDKDVVIKNQVATIDRQITKVTADAEAARTALEGKKAELLSITYEV